MQFRHLLAASLVLTFFVAGCGDDGESERNAAETAFQTQGAKLVKVVGENKKLKDEAVTAQQQHLQDGVTHAADVELVKNAELAEQVAKAEVLRAQKAEKDALTKAEKAENKANSLIVKAAKLEADVKIANASAGHLQTEVDDLKEKLKTAEADTKRVQDELEKCRSKSAPPVASEDPQTAHVGSGHWGPEEDGEEGTWEGGKKTPFIKNVSFHFHEVNGVKLREYVTDIRILDGRFVYTWGPKPIIVAEEHHSQWEVFHRSHADCEFDEYRRWQTHRMVHTNCELVEYRAYNSHCQKYPSATFVQFRAFNEHRRTHPETTWEAFIVVQAGGKVGVQAGAGVKVH